jgi:hypothetical protein
MKARVLDVTPSQPLAVWRNPIAGIIAAVASHRAAIVTESPPAIAPPSLLGLHCALVI